MATKPEAFDIDTLISLKGGVARRALKVFFRKVIDADAKQRTEIARFATRAAWRVLPEILADNSEGFEEPIKRNLFAVMCRALFASTHPNANFDPLTVDVFAKHNREIVTKAADAALSALAASDAANHANNLTRATDAAADAATFAAAERRKPLREPLLLAMREDLVALHANQTLVGRELWPRESASRFDVNRWFRTFSDNVERFRVGPDVLHVYKALLEGFIERVIRKYPLDLFEELYKSTASDYQEWGRNQPATPKTNKDESPKSDADATIEETSKSPRDTLHAELPSATDHLDQERLAEVLSTWLNKNQSHSTIGLFGDWGVGKSTFVNLLRRRLGIPLTSEAADDEPRSLDHHRTADYIGGEFNAWQYEHTDNIQAGLAQELIVALQANLKWWEKKWLTWRYHAVDLFLAMLAILTLVVFNLVLYLKDISWFSWLEGIGSLVGIGGGLIGIGSLLFAIFRYGANVFAHPLAKQLRTHLRLPSFVKELGTIPVMREQVRSMVNLRLGLFGRKQRLLFVVDDLDRCSPNAVVKVLEAVRLIMDLPNVVVLVAIDQKIALASLALRYKELAVHYGADPKSIARQYLGKVIHVPITLDNPAPEAVESYLRHKLWAVDDTTGTLADERTETKLEDLNENQPVETNENQAKPTSTETRDSDETSESYKKALENLSEPTLKQSTNDDPTAPQHVIKRIGLSQGQQDAFIQWANKLELANPRHIKRLDNAYNLIRMRYHDDEDRTGKHHYRLVMLMWIEYCRGLPLESYTTLRNYVRAEMAEASDQKMIKDEREALDKCNRKIGLLWDEVKAVWEDTAEDKSPEATRAAVRIAYHQVRTFVLPAIEKDNLKSCAK